MLLGIACSMWAALALGRHFDMEVELHAGQRMLVRLIGTAPR